MRIRTGACLSCPPPFRTSTKDVAFIAGCGEHSEARGCKGDDPNATKVFREIARLSNGICARFDVGSAAQLANLLRTVGRFATGGDGRLALSHAREALRQTTLLLE